MLGFGRRPASAAGHTATSSPLPRSPKSPSNIDDEKNTSLSDYLVSNPAMCAAFTQAHEDAESDDPETCKDAKNVIKMIKKLAADRAASKKRKAITPGQESQAKHFSFESPPSDAGTVQQGPAKRQRINDDETNVVDEINVVDETNVLDETNVVGGTNVDETKDDGGAPVDGAPTAKADTKDGVNKN